MAPVIPLVAAVAGAAAAASGVGFGLAGLTILNSGLGFSFLGATAFANSLAGFVVSTALNAVGSRMFPGAKPSTPNFAEAAKGQSVMVQSSVETHKIIYGRAKVSGPIVYAATTSSGLDKQGATITGTNLFLHLVIALAGHEVDEIGDVYFGDQIVTLDADGWATSGPYPSTSPTTVNVTRDISTAVRAANGSGDGSITTYTTTTAHGLSAQDRVTITDVSRPEMNGTFVVASVPTTTTFTVAVRGSARSFTAAGGKIQSQTTGTTTTSLVRVKKYTTGSPDQMASADLAGAVPNWDANRRLRGIAYAYVRLQYSQSAFPQGIPNVSFVVRGKKVYDPRTGTTAWSDNVALCTRDYLVSDYGFNCGTDEINDTYFAAAANHCDETVTYANGATDRRYRCNGVVDTATAPVDNLNALVAAMAGAVTYVQGKFRGHAGVYDSPVADLTIDMLAGPVKVSPRTTRQQLFNAVQGTYIDPFLSYQPTDFPPVQNATYTAEDGGKQIFKDLQLPFTNDPESAQRVAKVILEQARQSVSIELPLMHSALSLAVFDTVTYTDPYFGWDHKVFRIRKLTTTGTGPIVLTLQEESSAAYDWNAGQATTIDISPDTNLPNPFTVSPPRALEVTESLYVTRNGAGVKTMATLTWLASQDYFIDQYEAFYKLSTDSDYKFLPRTRDTTTDIPDIAPGTYDFGVRAINAAGVTSYNATTSKQITGLSAPPSAPQNLQISVAGNLAILRWDQSADLDVKVGGSFVFRHSPTVTDGWTASTRIGEAVPGSSTLTVLPLKPGVYLAKAVDSSGIESTTAASAVVTQDSALAYTNLASLTEDPTFGGTKTNLTVSSSRLKLTSTGSQGTYLWHAGIDLGSAKNVRVTSYTQAYVVNTTDLIDSRTANIDDWASIDGSISADADATTYYRTTQTDPAGSPTWSAWNRLDSAETKARGLQFMTVLTALDPAYNIEISQLNVQVDEVA